MPAPILTAGQIHALLGRLGVTHVVTVPDSTLGAWEPAIQAADGVRLVRVCREGEAWAVAGGLWLGGGTPLVTIQCTGLFESGDAIRSILHDWRLPVQAIIGYRSYLNQSFLPGDTCLAFTEPVLRAWQIDYCFVTDAAQVGLIGDHLGACQAAGRPGAALLAEGRA